VAIGGVTPSPVSVTPINGESGSLLAMERMPFCTPVTVGAKVTTTGLLSLGGTTIAVTSGVNTGLSEEMEVTCSESVPGLSMVTTVVGVAPRKAGPKSNDPGLTAMSGAPMTVRVTGTASSDSSGSLLRIRIVAW
jgi:hypothetical protein